MVGVDPAAAMLDVGRHEPWGDQVEWIEDTAETFRASRRFDLIIMTGHAFQALVEDAVIRAALDTMAYHLKPGGRIVFESRNPVIDWDRQWARTYKMETPEGVVTATRRMIETAPDRQCLTFAWDYTFPDETLTSISTLRFLQRDQIEAFAQSAGLHLVELHGDWQGGPFDSAVSKEMIFTFVKMA